MSTATYHEDYGECFSRVTSQNVPLTYNLNTFRDGEKIGMVFHHYTGLHGTS